MNLPCLRVLPMASCRKGWRSLGPPIPRCPLGAPLSLWRPCWSPVPLLWSPPGLCQAGCALCMDKAALAALLQCTPPQFQMALQGLLPSLQELGHTEQGGSWGCCCPSVTQMLLWHLGWAVQRLLPQQPRGPEGLWAGLCSTSLGKLHLSPGVSTWPHQQGTPLLLALGKDLLAAIPNLPATATKINPEVRFSSLPGCAPVGERILAWDLRSLHSMPETSMLAPGREWVSGSPKAGSAGGSSSRISPLGVLPEGILCGHGLVCQHCTLLGARANAPTRFVPGLGGPGHSR